MNWRAHYNSIFIISLILIIAFPLTNIFSQNPTYYKIGETELETEDVYSMCSTSDHVLYLGVENGMMRYEDESFKYLFFPKEFNNHSLFHLTKNSKDEVFCIDLKGRIFQAVQDSLILIFTLENEYINTLPQLICGPDDNLYLSTKKIYKISPKGSILDIYDYESKLHQLKDNSFFFFDDNGIAYITKEGKYHYDAATYSDKDVNYVKTVYRAKQWLSYPHRTKLDKFPSIEHFNIEGSVQNYDYCYQLDTSLFYVLNHVQGVSEISIENDQIILENRFFEDHFISSYTSATNGTRYFGTFKQGVIVVPNNQVKTISSAFAPKSILDFEMNTEDEIYVSIRNKGLFKITKDGSELIEKSTKYAFSKIIFAKNLNYSEDIHGKDHLFYKTNYSGALKDLEVINEDIGIMLCNSGLNLLGKQDTFLQQKWEKKKNFHFYDKLRGRNLAVEYDQKSQKLYVANQYELYLIESKKDPVGVKYNNKPIIASELLFENDTLWITDFQKGILSLVNNQVKEEYSIRNGLYSNIVTQIEKYKNRLFVIASGKLQTIDINTGEITPISSDFGVFGKVNKVRINKEKVWILTDNSNILSIPLDELPLSPKPFDMVIKSIFNNDVEVLVEDKPYFKKAENKFVFNVKLSQYANNEETIMCFKLKGLDEDFTCIPYSNKGIEYKSLPPGKYSLHAYGQYGSIESNTIKYDFTVRQSFWLSTTFILTSVLFLLGFVYYFLKARMKIQDKRTEQKYREHQFNLELLESKLVALRSQMNPHFIFNSLNAIQDLILKNNTLLAYDYIVLFSQLARSTLNFSTKEYIPLGKEIEFLSIYLKLEKLRFNDDFSYTIEAKGMDYLMVPTLVIQPFIENALKHGLRHKSGAKKLEVKFSLDSNDLRCIIRDNGIGQEAALKIKKRQGNNQESFALDSIRDRLRILSKKQGQMYSFEIIDLVKNGESSGTEVRLSIPIKKNTSEDI